MRRLPYPRTLGPLGRTARFARACRAAPGGAGGAARCAGREPPVPRVAAVRAFVLGLLLPALIAPPSAAADAGLGLLARYAPATADAPDGLVPGSGSVAYAVDDEGTLWLAVALRGAAPDAAHEVHLVCGPTVSEACGDALLAVVVSDARGDADSAEIPVTRGDLEAAPFGAGARLDHLTIVDLLGFEAYVSDPLMYVVP